MIKKSLKSLSSIFIMFALLFTSCSSNNVNKKETVIKQNPDILEGKLDNGMSYYVLKNEEPKNRISLRLVVKVGSCMEEENQLGVAHFIEHMCFNGTEHFEKNSLIDYAELIGMEFGPNVNAYTSFEETVYKLEIPADNPEYLKTALLIFHDWASAVTFEPEELEKERGVIVEDWRNSRGLGRRLSEAVVPFELKDSGYVDHLPIGHMDIIKNISREEVLEFYNKWYKPELMSVVISGVCDPKVVKYEIEQAMADIPSSKEKIESPVYNVPFRTEKDVFIVKDAEMPYVQGRIWSQNEDFKPIKTEQDYKERIAQSILFYTMNLRLNEITTTANAPWLGVSVESSVETNSSEFFGVSFVPKDNMIIQSMQSIIDEIDRFTIFGITEVELKRGVDAILANAESEYERRLGISSVNRVEDICNHVITGKVCISDEDNYKLCKKLAGELTVDYINELGKKLFGDRGKMIIFYVPEKVNLPSKEEILNVWENYQSETELQNYQEEEVSFEVMKRPSKKAKIVSKNTLNDIGTTEYILENGARILLKKTDFDKNFIYMNAMSLGGSSLVSEDEYPSLFYAPSYCVSSGIGNMNISQFQKFLSDKNLSFNIGINDQNEFFSASSNLEQMETLLQLTNQFMTNPKFSDDIWEYYMQNAKTVASGYNSQTAEVFNHKIYEVLYGKNLRYSGINDEFVSKLDKDLSEKIYRERFENAADFTFNFVGDFDENKLIDLCCYYLGNLPSDKTKKENYKERPYNFPAGKNVVVKKGTDNQGALFIAFGGKLPEINDLNQRWIEAEMIQQLRSLVDIRLREVIREDKSGAYTISVSAGIAGEKERYYEFFISFSCEPEREQELLDAVLKEFSNLRNTPVNQIYIDKLNETWRRNFEVNQRSNAWSMNMLNGVEVFKDAPSQIFYDDTSVIQATTSEALKELAEKYLDIDNYVTVSLVPEK